MKWKANCHAQIQCYYNLDIYSPLSPTPGCQSQIYKVQIPATLISHWHTFVHIWGAQCQNSICFCKGNDNIGLISISSFQTFIMSLYLNIQSFLVILTHLISFCRLCWLCVFNFNWTTLSKLPINCVYLLTHMIVPTPIFMYNSTHAASDLWPHCFLPCSILSFSLSLSEGHGS